VSDPGPGGDSAAADAIAKQARTRQSRDKDLVEAAREGDRTAFGKLYDAWVDHVYDRAVTSGASAAEAREITEQTFLTVWHNLGRLRQPAAIGAKILQVAQRQGSSRVRGTAVPHAATGKPGDAEDRLTRTTDAANAAADPDVAAVLRDASLALDDRTREVLDLHYRQGLTASEVGAVLHVDAETVKETITKLPTALGVLTRARVLWRGGQPVDAELAALLEEQQITAFDATTVRTINRFAKDHDRARARSMIAVAPIELYAAIPLAAAPAGLKMTVAELLVTEGVPMDGSAFVKRDDRGEILAKPKDKREAVAAGAATARPVPAAAPALDKKAAAVAAAALAAEAVALADDHPDEPVAAEVGDEGRKTKVSERFRARKTTPAAAPVAAAGAAAVLEPAGATTELDHAPGGFDGGDLGGPGDRSDSDLAGAAGLGAAGAGGTGIGAYAPIPSPEDLDARAEGEAAAMGRAYTRPSRLDDGSDRAIPGAAHLDTDDGANRKKAMIIGGAVAAGVILLGGVAFALKGGGDETKTVAGGPKPTNPTQGNDQANATTTLPATTTTAVATTAVPTSAATTTAAPEGNDGAPTTPDTEAPAPSGGTGGGGGGAPSGGGATNPTAAPTTVLKPTTAQAATGSLSISGETRITNGYSMVPSFRPPTINWNLTSTDGFVVRVSGPGLDGSIDRGQSGSLTLCPGTVSNDVCTAPASGPYTYTLTIVGFDGSTRAFGSQSITII